MGDFVTNAAYVIGGLLLIWGCWAMLFFVIDDILSKVPHKYQWLPGGWLRSDEWQKERQ